MANHNINNRRVSENQIMYHIALSESTIQSADIAVLPGDPKRVQVIAELLDDKAIFLNSNREYTSYLATVADKKILVISTGMGGPSAGIGIEELAMIGVKKFIRVGTCGTIQDHINIGDIVVTTASVRLDGTSVHYAPIEYPAVASFTLNSSIKKSSKNINRKIFFGITGSSDTFYPGQERLDNYSGYVRNGLRNSINEWRMLNVLNLDATCLCSVMAKRTSSEKVYISQYEESMKDIVGIIKDSIENNFHQN
jgi:uridine phosphorylase